ncbi:hypothetical protein [Hydrogenivirga sp. 128-5-R1-1]|uniref:hypothetical protein n=1 Tax=Hydrogenivirga sp. 128-5-R1-1 TaxID=392423 RepID=UPI00015F2C12|nr:hypothetical protein [Hydrogenivirga sp. 128-5-R1-1]EDP73121.1 hypothetical protein HG1285_09081 [Hydrogenivirga sp. 128-5-R1-1]
MGFQNLTKEEKEKVMQIVIEDLRKKGYLKIGNMENEVYIVDIEKTPEVEGRLIIKAFDEKNEKDYELIIEIVDKEGNLQLVDYFTVEA